MVWKHCLSAARASAMEHGKWVDWLSDYMLVLMIKRFGTVMRKCEWSLKSRQNKTLCLYACICMNEFRKSLTFHWEVKGGKYSFSYNKITQKCIKERRTAYYSTGWRPLGWRFWPSEKHFSFFVILRQCNTWPSRCDCSSRSKVGSSRLHCVYLGDVI